MSFYIHESSYLDEDVQIGDGTKIWYFCHVQRGARIGKNCSLGQNASIGCDVVLGDHCKLQNNVNVCEGVNLGNDVFIGPSVAFTNDLTPRARFPKGRANLLDTYVQNGVTIGGNATILCGLTIGENAFIGAGALVNADVPPHALMLGVPAKCKGFVCTCGQKLDGMHCTACGRSYERAGEGLREIQA